MNSHRDVAAVLCWSRLTAEHYRWGSEVMVVGSLARVLFMCLVVLALGAGEASAVTAACSGSFGASQTLTLTSTPRSGSTFTGWSGACTGSRTCKLAKISRKQKKPPVGTTFSFSLNESASITLAFKRAASGRHVPGKCVAQTSSNKHQPNCPLSVSAGSLKLSVR
jgi:hypothetical protein